MLKATQGQECRPSQQGFCAKWIRRKYDEETSEGVPCSFAYDFLAVQSHLTVKIVAPRVSDSLTVTLNNW